jgi:hypothetical protein
MGSPTGIRKNDHRTEASSDHCQRGVEIAQSPDRCEVRSYNV